MYIYKCLYCVDRSPTDFRYDEITSETFDGINYEMGWIKVLSCKEGYNIEPYINGDILTLAQTAISWKMQPENGTLNDNYTDFAFIAKPGTGSVKALNEAPGYDLCCDYDFDDNGTLIDVANVSDFVYWSDDAIVRLQKGNSNQCTLKRDDFGAIDISDGKRTWIRSHGGDGLKIRNTTTTKGACFWDSDVIYNVGIEMHFGYQIGTFFPTTPPTGSPTTCVFFHHYAFSVYRYSLSTCSNKNCLLYYNAETI